MWTRLAGALLAGFGAFVLGLPIACGSLMLYSEHVYGDVDSGGPSSMLGGMVIAAILALLTVVWVMLKSAPRRP
jgi:undecaprenyl pyrophosphate phosphatase UppP